MDPLRIGLIGCGRIAQAVHIPLLNALRGAQLVALAEVDPANRAIAAGLAPKCTLYSGFQELIDSASVDAVVICVPPHLHAPSAIAAFKAGLHVYVEKPLAPSLNEAQAVISAWRSAGTIGTIGFNFRFHPQTQTVRDQFRNNEIGELLAVRSVFTILPHSVPQWKQQRSLGGGVLLDLASHHIDLLRYILGDRVVHAFASIRSVSAAQDNAVVQLTMESGASAQLFVSLGSVEENRLEFYGTGGKLVIDRSELLVPQHARATLRGARTARIVRAVEAFNPRLLLRSPGYEPSFGLALRAFVAATKGRPFNGPTLFDGAECLAVIEAAERAALAGVAQPVPALPVAMQPS